MKQLLSSLLLFGVLFSACEKGLDGEIVVEPKFQPFVDRFVEEAARRGKDIDFSDTGLSIVFRDAVDRESGGVCRGNHQIEIEKFYWEDLSEIQKEGLIFHELGHCELDRGHRNDTLPNGEWASRMRGDPIPEGASPIINYFGLRREYYVNELFDESTPLPDWAFADFPYTMDSLERVEVLTDTVTQNSFRTSVFLDPAANYEFELEVDFFENLGWVGVQFGGPLFESSLRVIFTGFKRFLVDSGQMIYGAMLDINPLSLINDGYNKITIRRIDDLFYVYMNESFIYHFDVPEGHRVSFESYRSATGRPRFRNIVLYELNNR